VTTCDITQGTQSWQFYFQLSVIRSEKDTFKLEHHCRWWYCRYKRFAEMGILTLLGHHSRFENHQRNAVTSPPLQGQSRPSSGRLWDHASVHAKQRCPGTSSLHLTGYWNFTQSSAPLAGNRVYAELLRGSEF